MKEMDYEGVLPVAYCASFCQDCLNYLETDTPFCIAVVAAGPHNIQFQNTWPPEIAPMLQYTPKMIAVQSIIIDVYRLLCT